MKLSKRFGYKDGHILIDVKPEEKKVDEIQQEETEVVKDEKNKRYLMIGGLMLGAFTAGYLVGVRDMIKDLNIIR